MSHTMCHVVLAAKKYVCRWNMRVGTLVEIKWTGAGNVLNRLWQDQLHSTPIRLGCQLQSFPSDGILVLKLIHLTLFCP